MSSYDWITGVEGGVVSVSGTGIVDSITGTVTIETGTVHTGVYSVKCASAGSASYFYKLQANTPTYQVIRLYFNFGASLPDADVDIFRARTTAVDYRTLTFSQSDSKLYVGRDGGKTTVSASTVAANTWYYLCLRVYVGGTTQTIDWQIDGINQTQFSESGRTATTFTRTYLGLIANTTGTIYFDDIVRSTASADYPIPPGGTEGKSPAGDGTHVSDANVMEFQDGTDIRPGTTTAYTAINSVPIGNTTTYIRQAADSTSSYAEITFADTGQLNILGASAILAYRAASTSADEGACVIIDEDATVTTVWGNFTTRADYSESSVFYKTALLPVPTGGWDAAAVNALYARCGGSNDSNPNPWWVDMLIEVAYTRRRSFPIWL